MADKKAYSVYNQDGVLIEYVWAESKEAAVNVVLKDHPSYSEMDLWAQ